MENKKTRKREKCEGCFYNGECLRRLSSCSYLKPQKEDIEDE